MRTTTDSLRPANRYRLRGFWGKTSVHILLILICLLTVIPMILIVSVSLSDEVQLAKNGYSLWPVGFTTFAYKYILQKPGQVLQSYGVTIVVTAVGTMLSLLVSSMLAYAMSRDGFKYRRVLDFYVFFTLLFSGGMVPFYILVTRYLQLKDNPLALILPYVVIAWYVLILRTSFAQLPKEIMEAARIDGAGEWRIFFQIAMPLSKPGLATIGLFYILRYWNDWFLALLFIDKPDFYPLQYLLYVLMQNINALSSNPQTVNVPIPAQSARMAMAVLAFGPALFSFLLVQKYFVRGLTIGALKG